MEEDVVNGGEIVIEMLMERARGNVEAGVLNARTHDIVRVDKRRNANCDVDGDVHVVVDGSPKALNLHGGKICDEPSDPQGLRGWRSEAWRRRAANVEVTV